MNQSEAGTPAAWENTCQQLMIGFGFASYWWKKCREFCSTKLSKRKEKEDYLRH